jgi:hypothetical protein
MMALTSMSTSQLAIGPTMKPSQEAIGLMKIAPTVGIGNMIPRTTQLALGKMWTGHLGAFGILTLKLQPLSTLLMLILQAAMILIMELQTHLVKIVNTIQNTLRTVNLGQITTVLTHLIRVKCAVLVEVDQQVKMTNLLTLTALYTMKKMLLSPTGTTIQLIQRMDTG